ncbi:MAG: hypothetical protein Q9226_005219 [Calogaya cf. arnoldii]
MYIHLPLDEQCIRVLTVLAGSYGSDIHINLSHVKLEPNDPPRYEALSYAWGSNVLSHLIYVDTEDGQQSLPVTENLYTALQHLRDESLHRTLWVDAVCINQRNDEERGQQVARMADIYRSAAKVIIWLGPDDADNSTAAIEALRTLASGVHVDWTTYTISAASEEVANSDWLDFTKMRHAPLFDEETWVSIVWLLKRSWFSRLWIWQEVYLARSGANVICGDDTISWEDLRKAIYALCLQPGPYHVRDIVEIVDRATRITFVDAKKSLKEVLERTKHAQCSDPRDKIYGVLNLVEETQKSSIQPDYTKTTVEVFRDVMLTCLLNYGDLKYLSCCELQDERGKFPSWVPDWSVPNKCRILWGAKACWVPARATYSDIDETLIVTGRHMGKIAEVQQILTDDLAGIVNGSCLQEIYAALARLTSWLRNQLGNDIFDRQLETICRTLCCNEFSDVIEPPNKIGLDCQATLVHFRILTDLMAEPTDDFLYSCTMFLGTLYNNLLGRSCVITDEGCVGLAPNTAHQGDSIVVLLGCQSPIVLRPRGDEDHLVVGEVYVHDLMTGEAFQGPLPSNWRLVFRYDEITGEHWDAFIDRGRDVWQVEDPRLGPLPEGWAEERHPKQHVVAIYRNMREDYTTGWDPRLMLPALRARDVELREFKLI